MSTSVIRKRVEIISVYVDSVGERIPVVIAIVLNVDSGRLYVYAARLGWTNPLIESLDTKQDLPIGEFKDTQEELIQAVMDKIKSLTLDEYQTFIGDSPSKIGIGANVSEERGLT